jgi:hypothetical protein
VPALVLDGFTTSAAGLLEVPIQVPSSWPGDTVVLGAFLTLDPVRSEVQASNTFAAITR